MTTKTIGSIILLSVCLPCFSQLSIEECYKKAQANYPLIKQHGLIEKTSQYNLSNANKGYLPQVMFSAKATYQSDVTQLPIDLLQMGMQGATIPTPDKDQYGATIDVSQTLWDGGVIRSQKQTIGTAAQVEQMSVEVSVYAINERINQLYFGILLADAQLCQNELLQEELKRSCNQVQSYIHNGIANQADLDAIKVDMLKAKQSKAQFINTKRAYMSMLSAFIGETLSEATQLVKPPLERPAVGEVKRPELALYNARIRNLEAQDKQITAGVMPKLGLFITGGYGKPGLDMFADRFNAYYIGGAKLSWNIGGLYTMKSSRNKIKTSISSIEVQRQTFLFNTNLDIARRNGDIDKYIEQLKYDDEIIALRRSVKQASEAKMANGTLSGTDLARDINAEQMAMQNKALHEAELLLAIYNLKFATNN